jgi:hypothetical protein
MALRHVCSAVSVSPSARPSLLLLGQALGSRTVCRAVGRANDVLRPGAPCPTSARPGLRCQHQAFEDDAR